MKSAYIILSAFLFTLNAYCINLTVEPGEIARAVAQGTFNYDDEEMLIDGTVNAADLLALAGLKGVGKLSLQNARLAGCTLDEPHYGKKIMEADKLQEYVFAGAEYTEITLPSTITEIPAGAFSG